MRQDLVKTYFPHWERASRRIRRFDIWANPLVELAHWIGVSSAALAATSHGAASATTCAPAARCKRSSATTAKSALPQDDRNALPQGRMKRDECRFRLDHLRISTALAGWCCQEIFLLAKSPENVGHGSSTPRCQ